MLKVTDWEDKTFYIRYFKSLSDFISTAKQAADETGNKMPYLKNNLDRGTTYPDQKELEDYVSQFDNFINDANLGGDIKKEKIKITDDERGIFDFSLASQGLYRSLEYYSKELEADSPNEFKNKEAGIVPDNFVNTQNILNKNVFTYKSNSGKIYDLVQQQEGTKKMLTLNPNAEIRTTKSGLIYAYPTSYNGFSLKFKTKNKKNYLLFEKKGGKAKMVDIYFPIHQSVRLKEILPSILLSKFLDSLNIQTRIYALRVYQESRDQWAMFAYPIKEYNDPLNIDYIAFNSAFSEFIHKNKYGSWWNGIKDMVQVLLLKDYKSSSYKKSGYGIAQSITGQGAPPGSRKNWVELFSRYRNWYLQQIEKGQIEPLRIDKKLIFFGGASYSNKLSNDSKERILSDFYLMLDKVDMQFNEKDAFERIYKRIVEDELSKQMQKYNQNQLIDDIFSDSDYYFEFLTPTWKKNYQIDNLGFQNYDSYEDEMRQKAYDDYRKGTRVKDIFTYEYFYNEMKAYLIANYKQYVINDVLIETYSYPISGEYSEPQESAEKLDKEFEEKIEKLETFLNKK